MRKATSDVDFVYDDGNLAGVCLGYDYCAEHEWGTKSMSGSLGMYVGDPKTEKRVFGYDRIRVVDPSKIIFLKKTLSFTLDDDEKDAPKKRRAVYAVILDVEGSWMAEDERMKRYEDYIKQYTYSFSTKRPLIAMWDEKAFMFWSPNKEAMETLFKAFQDKKMLKGAKSSGPFGGSGLYFGMDDFYSKEDELELTESQKEYTAMWKDITKNGIETRLEKAGCRYFALSPKVVGDRVTVKKPWKDLHYLEFWLNPMNQSSVNYGWFTVKDLDLWIEGKGPIPMKKD